MNLTYFHQYFKVNSGGTRSYEFSKHLVENGNKVTMITGNDIPMKYIDGIKIESTKTKYQQNFSFYRRIFAFIHFMIKSTIIGLKQKDTDIIYATSTPLTIGIPALIVSKLKRKKYIFEVRDVWPDIPIELGYINSKLLQKLLIWLEKTIYKNASHIVVLSPGMKENLVKKGVEKEKITIITNLSMNNQYDSVSEIERMKYKDKLLCIHPGTMGVVNGLNFILDLAEKYPDKDILYLLIGEGNQKEELKNRIRKNNIKNVIIKDSMPKNEIIKQIKQADVGLMIVEDYKILRDNSANKFFDFLAAGLPVIINYGGWQKDVLEKGNAGRGFDYEDKEGFYNYLIKLKNNRDTREELGFNAKKLAIDEYDSQFLSEKFEKLLLKVIKDEE